MGTAGFILQIDREDFWYSRSLNTSINDLEMI